MADEGGVGERLDFEEEAQQRPRDGIGLGSSGASASAASGFNDWPTQFSVGGGDGDGDDGVADVLSTDVDILRRVWSNEKAAPDILPYEAQLVERVQEQILLMEDNVSAFSTDINDELMVSLYRMDVNRTLFLLRSYLRTRLRKIEKFSDCIISNTEMSGRLSNDELEFACRYGDALGKHLEQTVLTKLPDHYQSMSKQTASSEEDDMIPKPQLDTFVFCKSKGAIGSFQIDDKGDETVDLMKDDLYILRYKPIRRLLEENKIDLI